MRLYRTTVDILVGIPDNTPSEHDKAVVADSVSGVLSDNGVYASQGGPLGIVDWGYSSLPAEDGMVAVPTDGIVDADGFVIEGAFLGPLATPYDEAVQVAAGLLADGGDSEYRRGVVNLIADLFGVEGMPTDERMIQVDADIEAVQR